MADAVVPRVWYTEACVSERFGRRVVPIEVRACVAALHQDAVDADVGRPVEGIVNQVADGDFQGCRRMETIREASALKLEFEPGQTRALKIGAPLTSVRSTCQELRRRILKGGEVVCEHGD